MKSLTALLLTIAFASSIHSHELDPLIDYRIGSSVPRDADGSTKRSTAVIAAYKRIHPCPSTGLTKGACPGWALNHVIPLSCSGIDAVSNLQWVPHRIKSCKESWCIDRFERKINEQENSDKINCKNQMPYSLK